MAGNNQMQKQIIPFVAHPANVFHDCVDIFILFLDRIGVVKSQIAGAIGAFLRNTKIEAERFSVTDMQVTIRLRRKTGGTRLPFLPDR